MTEIIKTSTTVIDLHRDSVFAEIEECLHGNRLEINLLTFEGCPHNPHTTILKCVGTSL